jgi:hypothetical protein
LAKKEILLHENAVLAVKNQKAGLKPAFEN